MTDPRDVGLPPSEPPAFVVDVPRRDATFRDGRRRRTRRLSCAAATVVAVAGLGVAVVPGADRATDRLIAPVASSGAPTTVRSDPSAPVATPGSTAGPRPTAAPPAAGGAASQPPVPPTVATPSARPSSPRPPLVSRVALERGPDLRTCRDPQRWTPQGWCFSLDTKTAWPAGHTVLLRVTACRLDGAGRGELRFTDAAQARFAVSEGRTQLFTTAGAPAGFLADEDVAIEPGRCLQWRSAFTPADRPADLVVEFALLIEGAPVEGSEPIRMYDAG